MVGDRERSARTIALLHGKRYALTVSIALFSLFVVITLIPLIIGWLSLKYLFIFLPVDIIILFLSNKLFKSQTIEEGHKIIRELYLILTIFIIIFVIISIL